MLAIACGTYLESVGTDENRVTPAVEYEDGNDYIPSNKWVIFGHHFGIAVLHQL